MPRHHSNKFYRRLCLLLDVLMLLSVAAFTACLFMRSPKEHYDIDRNNFPIKGIDVSAHNGHIDFDSVAADTVSFVYIKATEGTDFCDANFSSNYHGAVSAGLHVGPYHFFRFDTPAEIQVRHLLNSIGGRTFDLPIAIDVEAWGNSHTYDLEEVRAGLRSMIEALQAEGYPVLIYTNKHGHKTYVGDDFDNVRLWLCALSAAVPADATLWQHSHRGTVKGIRGPVDLNTFNGSAGQFSSLLREYTIR